MDIEKFTERAQGFIQSAQGLALRSNHQVLKPEHILKVLIDDEEGLAARLIRAAGGRPEDVRSQTEIALAKLPKVEGPGAGHLALAPETAKLLEQPQVNLVSLRESIDTNTATGRCFFSMMEAIHRM